MAEKSKPEEVDAYLAEMPADIRAALQRLREVIRAAAPEATERVSYKVAVFRHQGSLVGFGAPPSHNHCSLFVMSPPLVSRMKDELAGYEVSGATIHFQPDKPLPRALVTKLVKARIEENETARQAAPRRRA
jgi:uncharacterized protein YdhG (YjbR/CyaY superfamily)